MRYIIAGKSASGKSTLARILSDRGLTRNAITTTTRDPREGEVNGVDYYFWPKELFEECIGQMVEHDQFNGWYYGVTEQEFNRTNLSILTPRGVKRYMKKFGRKNLFIIYVDTPILERYDRIIKRGDSLEEAFRRFVHDEEDFRNFKSYDLRIDGSDESFSFVIQKLFASQKPLHKNEYK